MNRTEINHMSIKHDLQYTIMRLLNINHSSSFATQSDRRHILKKFAGDLISLGYRLPDIHGLKQKHIKAVIKDWQDNGLSSSTIKNCAAVLRHLCDRINKRNIMPTNEQLNISKRVYLPKINRALVNPDFSKVSNMYIKISLEMQRVFGLRREESLKLKPHLADKGEKLVLLSTWCKGGRARQIPILTEEQRYWIQQAKNLTQRTEYSLIPQNKTYIQHRNVYDKQALRAGLRNLHGLRHAYAQKRYEQLTGWAAPINGGFKAKQLTTEQRKTDFEARMILTEELGHSREQITVNYLGR